MADRERKKRKKINISFAWLKTLLKRIDDRRDSEYSKRLLTKIINHSLFMMWGTYVLAWYGKTEIAETLSKTIAASIIAVVVGYLTKSVIENISKHTDTFGKNDPAHDDEVMKNILEQTENIDISYNDSNRDC